MSVAREAIMSAVRTAVVVMVAAGTGCCADDLAQQGTVCAKGPTLPGIDVSKWQGTINWDAVAGSGVGFAFVRVNHGLDEIDEQFAANWSEARRVGIARGAYQYFLPDQDALAQADLFLDLMGPLEPGDLPPVLDVENSGGGMPPTAIADQVRRWMDRVGLEVGLRPIIYTGKYFWQDNVGSAAFRDHPLWIAHWDVVCPDLPDPWTDWAFHQTGDDGTVPGIGGPVDTDVFNGSIEDLAALAVPPPCEDGVDAPCPAIARSD